MHEKAKDAFSKNKNKFNETIKVKIIDKGYDNGLKM
jgi:hypothetical protein